MATIGSYTNKDFSPAAKLLSYDSSGVTALIPGQSLLDYIGFDGLVIALDNRVEVVRTTDLAVTEDLPVGRVIYTTGVSVENDGGGGHYVVVIAGTGGIPMDNGNELLLLPIGDLTGSDATNADVTTSTGSQTVTGALDDRVVRVDTIAQRDDLPNLTAELHVEVSGIIYRYDDPGWTNLSGYVIPEIYGALADGSDETTALANTDAQALADGVRVEGNGKVYSCRNPTFECADFRNINFKRAVSHVGNGPSFNVNQTTGVVYLDSVTVREFTNNGAKALAGEYAGTPKLILRGVCDFSSNGSKVQTITTAVVNTSTDFVIPVDDGSIFSVGNDVWIGDGKFDIASTTASSITLTNNGSTPTILEGTGQQQPSGQFVTLDRNGRNGITIGDGTGGWDLDIPSGVCSANDNGWFGIFHWSNSYRGKQDVAGVTADRNGYIGIGLGLVDAGSVCFNKTHYNGNNGIDSLEAKSAARFYGNDSKYNGVEGLFIGGDGEVAAAFNNDLRFNNRMGLLMFGRNNSPENMQLLDNDCRDNYFRSITATGPRSGAIKGGAVGGTTTGPSVYIEGKNGQLNPDIVRIEDIDFYSNPGGGSDVGGNVGGYTDGGADGAVWLNNNNYFGRVANTDVANGNERSIGDPVITAATSQDQSVSAGSPISVSIEMRKPEDSSIVETKAEPVVITITSDIDGRSQANVDILSRTTGAEVYSSSALILGLPSFGDLAYNLTMNTSALRYVHVRVGNRTIVFKAEWT